MCRLHKILHKMLHKIRGGMTMEDEAANGLQVPAKDTGVGPAGADASTTTPPTTSREPLGWWFFVFAAALLASLAAGFALPDRKAILVAAVPGLLAAMAFTQLHRFKSFKGAGFEAVLTEARVTTEAARTAGEQAEAVTQEAVATLAQLRATAAAMATATLDTLAYVGVYGSIPFHDKVEKKNDMLDSLRDIGCSTQSLGTASKLFDEMMDLQHAMRVRGAAAALWRDNQGGQRGPDYDSFLNRLDFGLKITFGNAPTPPQYRSLLADEGLLNDDAAECLEDYEHYVEHRTLRRPDALGEVQPT